MFMMSIIFVCSLFEWK